MIFCETLPPPPLFDESLPSVVDNRVKVLGVSVSELLTNMPNAGAGG